MYGCIQLRGHTELALLLKRRVAQLQKAEAEEMKGKGKGAVKEEGVDGGKGQGLKEEGKGMDSEGLGVDGTMVVAAAAVSLSPHTPGR